MISSTETPDKDPARAPISGVGFVLTSGARQIDSDSVLFEIVAGPAPRAVSISVTNGVTFVPRGTSVNIDYEASFETAGDLLNFAVGAGDCVLTWGTFGGDRFNAVLRFTLTTQVPANATYPLFTPTAYAVSASYLSGSIIHALPVR
jgi:hypothetical protein